MPFAVTLMGMKRRYERPVEIYRTIHERQLRPDPYGPPRRLGRSVRFSVGHVDGWPVYEVVPKRSETARDVVYFHGGAYIAEIEARHWRFVAEVAKSTAARITVPIYPLAPLGTAERVVAGATEIARAVIARAGAARTTIVGDSAGGGLALAVAQQLRDAGVAAPRTVLISPWLDVTMTDAGIAEVAQRDPMLAPAGLAAAGNAYRGSLDPTDPRVSPLFGDLCGLGPITVLCGTDDLLVTDARRLAAGAAEVGVPLDYHEAPGMIHVYPLLPIPEAKRARAIIAAALTQPYASVTGSAGPA